jgi:hypothetical protein
MFALCMLPCVLCPTMVDPTLMPMLASGFRYGSCEANTTGLCSLGIGSRLRPPELVGYLRRHLEKWLRWGHHANRLLWEIVLPLVDQSARRA